MAETENVLIQTHTYDAVGHCIYCGTKDGKLTTEHVIPYGLIGRLKLPAASCTPCQKIIHPMETWCQTKFLGHVRYRLNVPPRKNRPRPASHPMTIKTEDGRELSVSVPIADLPRVLSLPMLPPPGLLLGPAEAASNQFRCGRTSIGKTCKSSRLHMGKKAMPCFRASEWRLLFV